MALIIGDVTCTTGLSKRVWDTLKQTGYPGEQMTEEETVNYNKRKEGLQKTCYAIAKGVVEEIQANAAVSTNVSVASVSLVTPGTGTSGPGSGSGSGTVS